MIRYTMENYPYYYIIRSAWHGYTVYKYNTFSDKEETTLDLDEVGRDNLIRVLDQQGWIKS